MLSTLKFVLNPDYEGPGFLEEYGLLAYSNLDKVLDLVELAMKPVGYLSINPNENLITLSIDQYRALVDAQEFLENRGNK